MSEEILPRFYNNDGYEVRLHVNDIYWRHGAKGPWDGT